jgi:hypothetical protein
MKTLTLGLIVVGLFGCQAGETRSQASPPPTVPLAQRPAPPEKAPASAMMLVASEAPPAQTDVSPPFTLTASDGSGLIVTRVDAKAVVQGPLAFTELHLYFRNPEDRTREGTFAITLPAAAAVSRFAMEQSGQWQEAEVVEKATARRVYDDFLHRKQDPALLEKAAGNQFTAKVFPIAARSDKHLVVSFSQELPGRGYVLPLRGLPKVERVDVQITSTALDGTTKPQTLSKTDWQPDQDFAASIPAVPAVVAAGAYVVGAVPISTGGSIATSPPTELTLLVDTSASRALGFARYVASIRSLVDAMRARYGANIPLQVVAFDQDTQPIFDGTLGGYSQAQDKLLLARGAAGASNLAQAVAALIAPKRRLVIVTDGVLTAGPETPELTAAIKKLPIERVDVVLAGGIRDERLAAAVARPGLAHAGDVFDLDRGVSGVAAGLADPVLVDVPVQVPGATWAFPKTVSAIRPGTTVMVFARMAKPSQAIDVYLGNERHTMGAVTATEALVERAVAASEIEELETKLTSTTDKTASKTLRDDIAKRSIAARVISSQTSMLVLESDADYARYKIERSSLTDILVVGANGLEQQHRTMFAAAAPDPAVAKQQIAQNTQHPQAMALDEGHMGRSDLARTQAIEQARSSGILGSASSVNGAPSTITSLDSVTTDDVPSGFDDGNVYGGLLGNEAGEMDGGFGYGRSGSGPGGGGTGEGTIGLGRYGTIGHGAGTGTGYGVGGGRGGMRGRSAAVPSVAVGQPATLGDLDPAIIRRYIKRNIQRIQYCYERELLHSPALTGTVSTQFVIGPTGQVAGATATGVDPAVSSCVAGVIRGIEFPRPVSGTVQVRYPIAFRPAGSSATAPRAQPFPGGNQFTPRTPPSFDSSTSGDDSERPGLALTGKLAEVMIAVRAKNADKALAVATAWHDESPGDVLGLIALGEALEAKGDITKAARIYGSIIDLFPTRADMRRFAGERLERLGAASRALVVDTYRKAVADRPDHATGHRLLAYALLRAGDIAAAYAEILAGVDQKYPEGRFRGADRVLGEDAGMIAAAYLANGGKRDAVLADLSKRNLTLATTPSTRFLMYWETDANDVDFHIKDSKGGHAWYSHMELESGGSLYADVTTGYGPECFAIPGTPSAGPYALSINYFSQGPMGYGMGLLQIQRFDGKGFVFQDRPYVIMTNHAFVDLGTYQ